MTLYQASHELIWTGPAGYQLWGGVWVWWCSACCC